MRLAMHGSGIAMKNTHTQTNYYFDNDLWTRPLTCVLLAKAGYIHSTGTMIYGHGR